MVGRAMERVVQVARETGYLDGVQEFRGPDVYGYLPPDKVVALCTGSQGEPRAALSRIAQDDHPDITLARGDRVIFSSRTIPGNEKAVSGVINGLIDQGIEVITDRTHLVHVSGHPRVAEMEEMLGWVKPKILIPVHGEALHLSEHAAIGRAARHSRDRQLPQRRSGPARARRRPASSTRCRRPGLQGRRGAGRRRKPHHRRSPAPELCRHGHGGAGGDREGRARGRSRSRIARHSRTRPRRRAAGRCRARCGRTTRSKPAASRSDAIPTRSRKRCGGRSVRPLPSNGARSRSVTSTFSTV